MPFWVWASYYSPKRGRQEESFTGSFPTEASGYEWGNRKFASLPGATFRVVFSKSTNRDTARNEHRFALGESGERGSMPEVLDIRFKNMGNKEE